MTEYSLHSEVKDLYSASGDELEVKVNEGFVVDILKENLLIEIQTRNFSSIRNKLVKLVRLGGSNKPRKIINIIIQNMI